MSTHSGLYKTAVNASLFLFLCSAVLLLFFVLGNVQEFLESTLLLLLDVLEWALVGFLAAHIVAVISGLSSRAVRRRLGRLIFTSILGFLYGGGVLTAVHVLDAWLYYE